MPPYDVLRALDYFQAANAPYDLRLADAIDVVRSSQDKDGHFGTGTVAQSEDVFLSWERLGSPSGWNTLRAVRVLGWWDRRNIKQEA